MKGILSAFTSIPEFNLSLRSIHLYSETQPTSPLTTGLVQSLADITAGSTQGRSLKTGDLSLPVTLHLIILSNNLISQARMGQKQQIQKGEQESFSGWGWGGLMAQNERRHRLEIYTTMESLHPLVTAGIFSLQVHITLYAGTMKHGWDLSRALWK